MTSEGQVVFRGTSKKGRDFIIRYPTIADTSEMHRYINELSSERTFIRFQGEKISPKDEHRFLEKELQRIEKKQSVLLLAYCGVTLIGISEIDLGEKIHTHVGTLGISLATDFRNEGIGKIFIEHLIHEAEKKLPDLEIIILGVFQANVIATGMYKKMGFVEYGRLPQGVKRSAGYDDHILMYRKTSSSEKQR